MTFQLSVGEKNNIDDMIKKGRMGIVHGSVMSITLVFELGSLRSIRYTTV